MSRQHVHPVLLNSMGEFRLLAFSLRVDNGHSDSPMIIVIMNLKPIFSLLLFEHQDLINLTLHPSDFLLKSCYVKKRVTFCQLSENKFLHLIESKLGSISKFKATVSRIGNQTNIRRR